MAVSTITNQTIGFKTLARPEASSITNFPDTFQDFFSKISEDEDSDDLIVAMLEDKRIPLSEESERIRLQNRRGGVYRRSFNRKPTEYNNNNNNHHVADRDGDTVAAVSPAMARRRATSIAVTRQPPDLHRFLQAEQQRPWGHISPRSSSPCGLPPWQRPVSPRGPHPPRHPPVMMVAEKNNSYRSRTASMPAVPRHRPMLGQIRKSDACDADAEFYRVRSFSITPNGIFNLGDSFRSRRSRSINSVSSTGSSGLSTASIVQRDRVPSTTSQCSMTQWDCDEPNAVPKFKVAMLGASSVGKTALTCQFTTSEYICAYDTSLDEEFGQKTVSVMLDGQEADLEIVDHPACEMSAESFCSTYNPDVFVVVYSVVDTRSLKAAEDILMFLWKEDYVSSRGVILVGNKADLERKREVPMAAGRKLANSCGCKFIETSSGLDHNVDELLVGILAQVQLNPRRNRDKISKKKKKKHKVHIGSGQRMIRQLLGIKRKSRSCENLLIL